MNILYFGEYKKRFKVITDILSRRKNDKKIIELCFGDIYIANWCKENNIEWNGYDININFINYAKLRGFEAHYYDLFEFRDLPKCETAIMIGSFYHFYMHAEEILDHIMKFTHKFILSEPIKNLSSTGGLLGYLAKRYTRSGRGNETFRYNYESLKNTLESEKLKKYKIKELFRNDREVIFEITWE